MKYRAAQRLPAVACMSTSTSRMCGAVGVDGGAQLTHGEHALTVV